MAANSFPEITSQIIVGGYTQDQVYNTNNDEQDGDETSNAGKPEERQVKANKLSLIQYWVFAAHR